MDLLGHFGGPGGHVGAPGGLLEALWWRRVLSFRCLLFFGTVLGAGLGPKRDQKVTKKVDEEWEPKKTERKTFHDGFGPYSARCARPNVL